MTLDLSNSTVNFYLQDSKPEGDLFVGLKSHYNNKYLVDGPLEKLPVVPVEWQTNWWHGRITFQTDYTDKDIAGFYDFELYDSSNNLLLRKLTKVVNSWKGNQNTYYTGSNENNEQYILHK